MSERVTRLGLFVGGRSRRMGRPKGLLRFEGQTLLERALELAEALELKPSLVGDATPYEGLHADIPRVGDEPSGVGPLGGIAAMLAKGPFVALACDMPYVEASDVRALLEDPRPVPVLAPRRDRWEPLFARYLLSARTEVARQLGAGEHRLQALCDRCASVADVRAAALIDWDEPSDVHRRR